MDKELPEELVTAARCTEERFKLLRIPSAKIPESDWSDLPDTVRKRVPGWLPTLLANYSLSSGVLEYRDGSKPYVRQFRFFNPSEFEVEVGEGGDFATLPAQGFVPIAYESEGNVWVVKIADGPSGAIHLLERTGWDGGQLGPRNGLIFASSRLSLLLASMGVSEVSYYESPGGITSVLWNEEK